MADSGFEELERHFEAASLALGRGDRAAAATALRAVVCEAEVRDDAIEPLTIALARLGELELEDGRETVAEGHFQRALALGEHRLGAEHPDLAVLLNALSRLYLRRGAHELAEPLLQRLHAIKRTKGEDHPEVATVLASLANVRQHLGRYDAAEQLWRRVLEIRERTLAPNHVATASALERLAETCAARAKAAEAVQLMQRALGMRELTLGAAHPTVRSLRERIADLQLQAAHDDGDLGPPIPAGAPSTIPGWRAPAAAPPLAMPPLPTPFSMPSPAAAFAPAPVAAASARTFESMSAVATAAPRTLAIPYAPPLPATIPPLESTGAEQATRPPVALVMPGAADGGLAIQQLLAEIDAEAEADANRPALAARAMTAFRDHRGPAVVAGMVLLLGAAFTVARARDAADVHGMSSDLMRADAPTAALPGVQLPETPRYGTDGVAPSAATRTAMAGATLAGATLAATRGDTAARRVTEPAPRAGSETRPTIGASVTAAATAAAGAAREGIREGTREAARPAAPVAPSLGSMPTAPLDDIARAASAATSTMTQDPLANRLATVAAKSATIGESAPTATRGTSAQPARLIGTVPVARYPQALRQAGVEGEVRVTFEVDTLGRPDMRSLVILASDHELFTRAVRAAIPEMRFVPAEADGKKARWLVRMPFVFSVGRR